MLFLKKCNPGMSNFKKLCPWLNKLKEKNKHFFTDSGQFVYAEKICTSIILLCLEDI